MNNRLTELDLSNCPNLIVLECHDNQITELDLSNCPNLTHLNCHNNQLTELDISQNKLVEGALSSYKNPFRNHFEYNIDTIWGPNTIRRNENIEKYKEWCKQNYTYHDKIVLK